MVTSVGVAELGQAHHDEEGGVAQPFHLAAARLQLATELGVVMQQAVFGKLELQVGAHARQHRGGVDGLVDEVGAARFEAAAFVLGVRQRGQKDDGHAASGRVGLELAADLVAVHLRHHHVEHDEVGRLAAADLQRLGTH